MIGRLKEVDRDLITVPTGSCRLRMHFGSVFYHPLFGWSKYEDNKSLTADVERRNMDLGEMKSRVLEKCGVRSEFKNQKFDAPEEENGCRLESDGKKPIVLKKEEEVVASSTKND
ncbi:hypothetical protein AVEN_209786-1 [Araneus ventricosus]|uniref:Uncharacterized protein n=1 Tax=Araneus ventricosus TaxID=182803 RepID=A0A4Y2NL39_ARAVE|nr:hypothetical protein AVEN_209786-1 [Araneus ventricosus]